MPPVPAELLRREARVGHENRGITCPSRGITPGNSSPADRLGRGDNFSHRMTSTRPEVYCCASASGAKIFERAQMRLGEILDVDVIANRGSVSSRVIDPIDVDVRSLSEGRLQHQGDEVRFGFVKLADLALGVASGSIEIAQRHR